MQRDKALLKYAGRNQAEKAFLLISGFVTETFLSCRRDQWPDGAFAKLPQIHDTVPDAGPMAGILSAFDQQPHAAWLVIACDLPFLDAQTLEELIVQRDTSAPATAYRSAHGGLPEPLCAIYEPAARDLLLDALQRGMRCPRKVLINAPTKLIDLPNAQALDNVNHPEEYEKACRALKFGGSDAA
jgi:molybdopterin-guanine dinucleotide biosynthesis protein A